MGSPDIMAAWDEMCLKCAEYDAMVEQRDAARALAERRAGEIAAMKEQLRTLTSGFWYVDFHNPYLSAGHYLCLTADERVTMESLAAAPPPAPTEAGAWNAEGSILYRIAVEAEEVVSNLDLDPRALAALSAAESTGEIVEAIDRLRILIAAYPVPPAPAAAGEDAGGTR
jgi:hypothetical protein